MLCKRWGCAYSNTHSGKCLSPVSKLYIDISDIINIQLCMADGLEQGTCAWSGKRVHFGRQLVDSLTNLGIKFLSLIH